MKEAYLYDKLENGEIRCGLCNHACLIRPGSTGICAVRENRDGVLYTLVYDRVIARHVDPIEKKPLFHFLPGSTSYSIGTPGCNFKCEFCQNSDISQMPSVYSHIAGEAVTPAAIVREALSSGASTISYTYTEPTVFYELAVDTARLAAQRGITNIFVSNGYMTEECLQDISPDLHAVNIDLKAFTNGFYRKHCGAGLEPVLKTIAEIVNAGIWLEITTLLIPGLNDSEEELKALAGFLAEHNPFIPWHISRFHPAYLMTGIGPTSPESLRRAREIGYESGLKYVYTGNIQGDEGEKTFCHSCSRLLIDRYGFTVRKNMLKFGHCPACGAEIPGVWD